MLQTYFIIGNRLSTAFFPVGLFSYGKNIEELTYGFIEESLSMREIAGMTSPKLGLQNFGWREIFNFNIGDEFHILEETHEINPEPSIGETTQVRQTILKVIEAEYEEYELTYQLERRESFHEVKGTGDTYEYIHDTISKIYLPDPDFEYLPGEPIIHNERAYTNLMTGGFMPSKSFIGGAEIHLVFGDSCWSTPIWDGCWPDKIYYKGLGGPYGTCSGGISSYIHISKTLVYYSKLSGTWGSPLTFTGDKTKEATPQLRIFPNPARDYIMISCDRAFSQIHIVDSSGRVLYTDDGQAKKQYISLSGLKPGIYLIRLQIEEKSHWKRFIVN